MAMFAKQYCHMQSALLLPKGAAPTTTTTTCSLPALPSKRLRGKQSASIHLAVRSGRYHCSLQNTPDQLGGDARPKNPKESTHRLRASANDVSAHPLPLQGGGVEKSEISNPILKWWDIFNRCFRPYACIGAAVAVSSVSLLPVTSVAELTPAFFLGFSQAFTVAVFMTLYVIAVNQLSDVDIDRINKPYLPLITGEISMTAVTLLGAAFVAVSLLVAFMSGSSALQAFVVIAFVLGTAYSAKLPLLRWKSNPIVTLISMVIWRGLLFQLPVFLHIQVHALKKQMLLTKPAIFSTAIVSVLWVIMTLAKDIPDVEGDKANGIQSFAIWFGQERVFKFCVSSLMVAYAMCMGVGAASTDVVCRMVSVLGHAILASVCWHFSQNVDLKDKTFGTKFYMLMWKMLYAEYFLIHFAR